MTINASVDTKMETFARACEQAAHRGAEFLEAKLKDGTLSTSDFGAVYKSPPVIK